MTALRFLQVLALLPACASAAAPPTTQPVSTPSATATPQTAAVDPPTAGDGPCRCSWDNNPSAAPRVCKKTEKNYTGQACVVAKHPGPDEWGPMEGPLPPPALFTA